MAKKKKNEFADAAVNIGAASLALSVSGRVVQGFGGNTAGINALASGLPLYGSVSGAGMTLKKLKKI